MFKGFLAAPETSVRGSRRSSVISEHSITKTASTTQKRRSSSSDDASKLTPERTLFIKSKSSTSDFIRPTESIGIGTIPIVTKDFSSQSKVTETREMSSQSLKRETRETGVQKESILRDKGLQIEPKTKDNSSQWIHLEKQVSSFTDGPLPNVTTDNSTVTQHYTYTEKHYTYTEPQVDHSVDHSTTLIREVNPHFEPVNLILASKNLGNSSTFTKDESFSSKAPVKMIVQKTFSTRSGSLPPPSSNSKVRVTKMDYEYTDTEDDVFYYYTDRGSRVSLDKENRLDNRVTYIKERVGKPTFEPIELVIDTSSIATQTATHKRVRDLSLPNATKRIKVPMKQQQNIYRYEYEDSSSDFISDRDYDRSQSRQGFSKNTIMTEYDQVSKITEKQDKTLPPVSMTIEMKTSPAIELHLRDIDGSEGQDVRFDCVVSGKLS